MSELKCLSDGGTCALGGYCSECPFVTISELKAKLDIARKERDENAGSEKLLDVLQELVEYLEPLGYLDKVDYLKNVIRENGGVL